MSFERIDQAQKHVIKEPGSKTGDNQTATKNQEFLANNDDAISLGQANRQDFENIQEDKTDSINTSMDSTEFGQPQPLDTLL